MFWFIPFESHGLEFLKVELRGTCEVKLEIIWQDDDGKKCFVTDGTV